MEDAFGHQQRWARRCFQTLLYQWQWPDLGFLRHPGEEPKTPTYFFICYQIWYQQGNYLGRRSDSCRRRWTQEIQTYSFIPSQESKSTLLAGLKALLSYNTQSSLIKQRSYKGSMGQSIKRNKINKQKIQVKIGWREFRFKLRITGRVEDSATSNPLTLLRMESQPAPLAFFTA